jgi:8-oxo-dGTP diphosphatase
MSRDEFPVVVKALITHKDEILIGQKEDGDKSHSGKWHFLGGHIEEGEQLEKAVKREVKEETGLDVDVHQVIDVMTFAYEEDDDLNALQVLYHCEADSTEAEAQDDLQDVKWVKPDEIKEELWDEESRRIENRSERAKFIEKLKKMPVV